ncbi:MAG: TIGR00730 family Rossman fold protein [Planctomycetes bacterium]|nr:TIGR00730 family Rossman fold protein [Planctomycetota bacterium]
MSRRFSVTVYASSSERIDRRYFPVAEELGRRIAQQRWRLVFGGGRHGLMGAVSRGARAAGGEIVGVILQQFIDKNVHCELTREMASVDDMRQRKRGLDEAGDAYVALPGGLGTLEEVLEILSFKQLGFHRKPVVLLDALGYWQPLLRMLDAGFAGGFIQPHFRGIYTVAEDPAAAIAAIAAATPWVPGAVDAHGGGTA